MEIDLTAASARALEIRSLYEELEKRHHGTPWSPQELMIGYQYDIGELGRLVMAAENRWLHKGDVPAELTAKLSECLWWVLVLSDKLNIDITKGFTRTMDELHHDLTASVASEPA